jgi:DNA replication and repair protein RecF
MRLTRLNVHQLRNISSASLSLHPRYNIFHGANGSGKTSALEAVYLLGTGYSFCTRENSALIRHGEPALTVFARTDTQDAISIQKSSSSATRVQLNQHPCQRSSDLAHFLPCQVFFQDIFNIIDEGPSIRRSLLDWGLFHVKQSWHDVWKDYRRVLKQRNTLLRQKAPQQQFVPWNKMLYELATELDSMRNEYFEQWSETFQTFLSQLTDIPCNIHYFKGWDKKEAGKNLLDLLNEQFESDLHAQYTHSGAHQADIIFDVAKLNARQSLSRGQQKIILIALKLAQAQLLSKPCLYLFDDIAAELDTLHLQRFLKCLEQMDGQFFLTAIDPAYLINALADHEICLFEINDGCFT